MRINLEFERYTENFSLYTFKKNDRVCALYLPKVVTTRKQPFEIITSSRPAPDSAQGKLIELERENAELKRRLTAIRNLA